MPQRSSWTRRLARIRSMRVGELFDRFRQHATARVDAWHYRRDHDFAAEVQVDLPLSDGDFFFAPSEVLAICTLLWQRFPSVADGIVTRAERICRHQFDLLGYEGLDYGPEIDWHLDLVHGKRGPRKPWFKVRYLDFEEVGDSKITWELNRHQHLVILAKAYRLTGDEKFAHQIGAQWKHWHADNPYPIGMNWASSLEVAFRCLSWIWVYFLLKDTPAMADPLRHAWMRALAVSGRHIETYLSTYFSPNTHLLGEGVALFVLGVAFPQLPRASRWKDTGWNIVVEAAAKQVRADGFYFEQSTYYHVYALDLFLHARVLAAIAGVAIPNDLDPTLVRMLDSLCLLSRAGVPPRWGDDDGGRLFDPARNRAEHMLDPLSTGAVLFDRGEWKFMAGYPREETLWLLGERGLEEFEKLNSVEPLSASAALPQSGIYLMADPEASQQFAIDAGPHGPGHGHAGALGVTLVRKGVHLLIDPGTFEYVGESGQRGYYRGTTAHNTLRVDGLDQAESVGPFAWSQPPTVSAERWQVGRYSSLFCGNHDGYSRLPDPVYLRRWVFHRRGQFWLVRDVASGQGTHHLELAWHLGPTLAPVSTRHNLFAHGEDRVGLVTVEDHGWSQSAHRGNWSPVYGREERATVLTFGSKTTLPAEFVTLLVTDAASPATVGRLEALNSDQSVHGYRYIREGQEHHFFFANQGSWRHGNWSCDASFLYWAGDRRQDSRILVLCDATYCETGGLRVMSSDRRVGYAELTSLGGKQELFAPDPEGIRQELSLDRVEMESAATRNDTQRAGA